MQSQSDRLTYLWQEQKRTPFYRLQTYDPDIARKLQRSKKMRPAGFGLNEPVWVFVCEFNSPKNAVSFLRRISGRKPEKSSIPGEFVTRHRR